MSDTEQFFSRLDSADKRYAPYDVVAYEGVIPVDNESATELLLNPLPLLANQLDEVDDGWKVTVDRVNAEAAIPKPLTGGPHHLCVLAMVLPRFQEVHCLVYRFPETEQANPA